MLAPWLAALRSHTCSVVSCVQVIVRRGEDISGPPGPILVATRNDVLDDIVNRTPADRQKGEEESVCSRVQCSAVWVGVSVGRVGTSQELAWCRYSAATVSAGIAQRSTGRHRQQDTSGQAEGRGTQSLL